MKSIAKKTLFDIKPYVPGKPIEEVKRQLGLKSVIKLASNENPYGPSPKVLKAIQKVSPTINRYPDGNCFYLRKALSSKLGVQADQLIFGNGSDELIVMAVRAFVDEGDEVVIARPSFLIYDIASKIAGATIKDVPLKNFRYDLAAMKSAVTEKTKIIFLGNPDNPSGIYFTKKEIIDFMAGLSERVLVFLDEAYYEYVEERDYVQSVPLLKQYKNLFITRTFSKMYGLAGLRVGYGIGSIELVDILNRIREPFNVNSIAQVAALACLQDKPYYKKVAKDLIAQRKWLYQEFATLGVETKESHTNFILVKFKQPGDTIVQKLLKKGIIVRDMSAWGLNEYIRITVGKESENRKLIKTLKEVV